MTLIEISHRIESQRLEAHVLLETLEKIRVTQTVVNEYQLYLERYNFSPEFWIWSLGGVNRKGESYPPGVCVRDATKIEVDRRVTQFAEEMSSQVEDQLCLHKQAPQAIPNPIVWGSFFSGYNQAQAGNLKKNAHGLWACRYLYRRYRDYARHVYSEWVTAELEGQTTLLQQEEPMPWPADPRLCFLWKQLPLWRPWLLDLSPDKRNKIEQEPGIRALEIRTIGNMGKIISSAANDLRRREAAKKAELALSP